MFPVVPKTGTYRGSAFRLGEPLNTNATQGHWPWKALPASRCSSGVSKLANKRYLIR